MSESFSKRTQLLHFLIILVKNNAQQTGTGRTVLLRAGLAQFNKTLSVSSFSYNPH